jgi:hypothetical protein
MHLNWSRPAPRRLALALALAALAASALRAQQAPFGLLLKGEEAEAFLQNAEVVEKKGIGVGITNPHRLTLSDGTRTLRGAWKTIDVFKHGITNFEGGGFELDFRDSYKFEIAAYELDKLLGFGMVPPTVERRIRQEKGSLQLWVEGCMTEHERREKKISPKDVEAWNQQMYKVRLFHQLIYNTDHNNVRNILLDPDFRIYVIDNSRAFRTHEQLMSEKDLSRFSRSLLDALRRLEPVSLAAKLGPWLGQPQIDALLKRRDRILALAEKRVAEKGEGAVLYP